MTEPGVALTDYGLALGSAFLAARIRWHSEADPALRPWLALFFGSLALAALTGGTVHGFFTDDRTAGARLLWPLTLIAIGLTALAAWATGARLGLAPALASVVTALAAIEWLGYAVVVMLGSRAFAVAVLNYVPAAVFFLVVLLRTWRRTRAAPARLAILGLSGTCVASAVQQAGIGLHPAYFNHNALAHVVQAAALVVFFLGARRLRRPASGE